jgi:hypothetical protein
MTALWMKRQVRDSFLAGEDCGFSAAIADQIDHNGVELYAGLLNYGLLDVLTSIYPLCARLLGKHWKTVVDDYLNAFPPSHFNLNKTGYRFPQYVLESLPDMIQRHPYLAELADYEWAEMEMLECDEQAPPSELKQLDSVDQFSLYAPIVNPALALRHYRFPIIKVAEQLESGKRKPAKVNAAKSVVNVVIYRDPQLNRCRFLDVGDVAAAVLERVQTQSTSHTDLIALVLSMSPDVNPQIVIADFLAMIEHFQANRLMLGNRRIH